MGARDLLNNLAGIGVSIRLDGDSLIVSPRELLTGDIRDALREHKPDLVALLRRPPPLAPTPDPEDERPEPPPDFAAVPERYDADEAGDPIENLPAPLRMAGKAAARVLAGRDDEHLARLVTWLRNRDAECDERRLCVECRHFNERGISCRHPDLIAIQAPRDLGRMAVTAQGCPGFSGMGGAHA